MTTHYSNKMSSNPPNFAQLSNINKVKDVKKIRTIRRGHLLDYVKTNPWRTLHNY